MPGKVTLTHARFFYPDLRGLMTETGLSATDNSRWKMVAVTFDDGPKDYPSTYTLDALRKIGRARHLLHRGQAAGALRLRFAEAV